MPENSDAIESRRTISKPRPSAVLQYTLLAVIAVMGLIHVAVSGLAIFLNMAHGRDRAGQPFFTGTNAHPIYLTDAQARAAGLPPGSVLLTVTFAQSAATAAGLHVGDAVYTIDGRPYQAANVLGQELLTHTPGQTLDLTVRPAGTSLDSPPTHALVTLAPQRPMPPPLWAWFLQAFLTVLPVFCLLTGLYVVFARPLSLNAWLVLGVLAYISALLLNADRQARFLLPISLIWRILGQSAMPICFMFLGVGFPRRALVDVRWPWLKWVLLAPTLALLPFDLLTDLGIAYRFPIVAPLLPWSKQVNLTENFFFALQISLGFLCLYSNLYDPLTSPDSRRRLRILIAGCSAGLVPLFALLVLSLLRGIDLGDGVPEWLALTVFVLLFSFPLTLAYVVIVQRAMDLRILLRQGTKYFFARQSILILGILLASWMSYEISLSIVNSGHRGPIDVARLLFIIVLFIAYRRVGARRMQRWIDQKFFREAYSTEQILSELSDEARNFTETDPLLETITRRLGETLHIDRIAVFLRAGEIFQLQFATGLPLSPGVFPALPATSTTITNLTRHKAAPANVYVDDPTSWLVDATDAERSALSDLSTELLVPLPGRNRLVGVIALGPKSSEEPYSKTDRQLLQSIASQTGLALENAELLENLTVQLAQRASINREIEIAREVQERLFPQSYPKVEGIGLAGFCRPAQFVGGDYYDFFLIPGLPTATVPHPRAPLAQGGVQTTADPTATAAVPHPRAPLAQGGVQTTTNPNAATRLAIAIGDISGKGISAALLMASLRASLRSVATLQANDTTRNLATLMQHVNRLVYEASTSNRYATFFYAELDPATRVLTYVNAGHNCPAILRGAEVIQLQPTGTVIGLLQDATYEQATLQLEPGDTVLAFTDGISEAMTADDEEWGEDRMIAAAQTLLSEPGCTVTAGKLLECLLAQADAFTAGAPQHDDMTLLVCTLSPA